MVSYSLKVMNAAKKSSYVIHKFMADKFLTLNGAKTFISRFLTERVNNIGYIIPGTYNYRDMQNNNEAPQRNYYSATDLVAVSYVLPRA